MTPELDTRLPTLLRFVRHLHRSLQAGEISTGADFDVRCDGFFIDATMREIETVAPGWTTMASFGEGVTLRHTARAMTAMFALPEYETATQHQQHLMEWTVLLHDIAKEPRPKQRDHRHAFRSAARAGRILHQAGFPVAEGFEDGFDGWYRLIDNAHRFDPALDTAVQDNTQLPEILGGVDSLFGVDAAIVIKAIALHLSLTVVEAWPAPAALTSYEEKEFIDAELLPVLGVMLLADSGGWEMFNPETLKAMYAETRAVVRRLADH